MADRRSTPDILGDLLGGSPQPPKPASEASFQKKLPLEEVGKSTEILKDADSPEKDLKYFESLLEHAGSALVLVAEVLGHQKLVDWLEEMLDVFGSDETVMSRKAPADAFRQSAATWAEKHLGAKRTKIRQLANGLMVKSPYEIDVWAQFRGEGSQADLDVWIECRDLEEPVRKRDIMKLIQKGTDVFHAAHTEKQDFWFDRLLLIANSSFDADALDMAGQLGVTCVAYDGTNFQFKTRGNWKLKPNWLRDAEASEGITWHPKTAK